MFRELWKHFCSWCRCNLHVSWFPDPGKKVFKSLCLPKNYSDNYTFGGITYEVRGNINGKNLLIGVKNWHFHILLFSIFLNTFLCIHDEGDFCGVLWSEFYLPRCNAIVWLTKPDCQHDCGRRLSESGLLDQTWPDSDSPPRQNGDFFSPNSDTNSSPFDITWFRLCFLVKKEGLPPVLI